MRGRERGREGEGERMCACLSSTLHLFFLSLEKKACRSACCGSREGGSDELPSIILCSLRASLSPFPSPPRSLPVLSFSAFPTRRTKAPGQRPRVQPGSDGPLSCRRIHTFLASQKSAREHFLRTCPLPPCPPQSTRLMTSAFVEAVPQQQQPSSSWWTRLRSPRSPRRPSSSSFSSFFGEPKPHRPSTGRAPYSARAAAARAATFALL
jgi:hypothetical protein